ncbi:hypothetical protein [Phenylobacterium sp.]|uniref:hypothetical protein n=1 Tax=Phenylobacterium sp. TaxID=1871053 RepID=UPI002ED8C879
MTWRTEIRFRSAFPDDAAYEGDVVDVQPGNNIAETLKAALEELDYRVSDPIDGGDHGWELDIWQGRQRIWLQISVLDAEECYLITNFKTFWLWSKWDVFRTFLRDLQRILEADSRFRRIGWFQSGGSAGARKPAAGPFDP